MLLQFYVMSETLDTVFKITSGNAKNNFVKTIYNFIDF